MKVQLTPKSLLFTLSFFFLLFSFSILAGSVEAQTISNLPPVDVSDPGFRLIICDGPAGINDPKNHVGEVGWAPDPKFVACDFNGLMKQAQHLINIAIVGGVLVAIIGLSWAGLLMISGKESNINKAKDIFPKLFLGFIIMLSAWFIVHQILTWLTRDSGFSALLGK